MKPYCETVTQFILPTLRALIAKELIEKHKLTQQEAAKKLGISQAAVSQYTRELRGFRTKILQRDKKISQEIENLAAKLISGDLNFISSMEDFCNICKNIRKKRFLCELHMECSPSLEKCSICIDQ